MSNQQTESDRNDLGPMPEPQAHPGEHQPGGVDALPDDGTVLPADPSISDNPAVEEIDVPDPLQTMEDTSTEATKAEDDATNVPPQQESPA